MFILVALILFGVGIVLFSRFSVLMDEFRAEWERLPIDLPVDFSQPREYSVDAVPSTISFHFNYLTLSLPEDKVSEETVDQLRDELEARFVIRDKANGEELESGSLSDFIYLYSPYDYIVLSSISSHRSNWNVEVTIVVEKPVKSLQGVDQRLQWRHQRCGMETFEASLYAMGSFLAFGLSLLIGLVIISQVLIGRFRGAGRGRCAT